MGFTLKAAGNLADPIAYYRQANKNKSRTHRKSSKIGSSAAENWQNARKFSRIQKAIALHGQHRPFEAERLRRGLKKWV